MIGTRMSTQIGKSGNNLSEKETFMKCPKGQKKESAIIKNKNKVQKQ